MMAAVNAYRATLNMPALPESQIDNSTFSRLDVRVSKAINLGRGRKIEGSLQVVNLLGRNNLGGVGSAKPTCARRRSARS